MTDNHDYSLQIATQVIARAIKEDPATVRRRFRHWAGLGIVPEAARTGSGVGTRRAYAKAGVLLGALLALLARHGIEGEALTRLSKEMEPVLCRKGLAYFHRSGGDLIIDLEANGNLRAQIRLPGAQPPKSPEWARLTINIGVLASQLSKALDFYD
ncbi:MAG: hypothetical protein WD044_10135 [Dongiaceae bacterium]